MGQLKDPVKMDRFAEIVRITAEAEYDMCEASYLEGQAFGAIATKQK